MTTATYKARGFDGTIHPVTVLGVIVLSYPDQRIYVTRLTDYSYNVYYGLSVVRKTTLKAAIAEFNASMDHSFFDAEWVS